ncbi:hypothetical protein [Elioraea thermophila]|uniref:hypothetical protein n=1 Tax=Elioraea thermophila TaxID=2185104 RepID=UPI0013004A2D|nr:hypothetical protein [Elioraea thermophila]
MFKVEYPRRGMLLAMGTHSRFPDTWLINGVIRLNESAQANLFCDCGVSANRAW